MGQQDNLELGVIDDYEFLALGRDEGPTNERGVLRDAEVSRRLGFGWDLVEGGVFDAESTRLGPRAIVPISGEAKAWMEPRGAVRMRNSDSKPRAGITTHSLVRPERTKCLNAVPLFRVVTGNPLQCPVVGRDFVIGHLALFAVRGGLETQPAILRLVVQELGQ